MTAETIQSIIWTICIIGGLVVLIRGIIIEAAKQKGKKFRSFLEEIKYRFSFWLK